MAERKANDLPSFQRHLKSFVLPVVVTLIIPSVIYFLDQTTYFSVLQTKMVRALGLMFILFGYYMLFTTVHLFHYGKGTLAPWDPPKNLVLLGPYKYVRNPMITGIFIVLCGEAFLFASAVQFLWFLIFTFLQNFFVRFHEEPELLTLFGKQYEEYKENVPRWIPRFSPYELTKKQ